MFSWQRKMVAQAVAHLKNGNSLVTFAEGTRSKDGNLQSFKKGAFRIAKEVSGSVSGGKWITMARSARTVCC